MQKTMIFIALWGCAGLSFSAEPAAESVACTQRGSPSPRESAVLAEINRARQSPRQYADTIARIFGSMDGAGMYARGSRWVSTMEKRLAVDDALRFLASVEPAPPLSEASCLNLAAARHAKAKGSTGNHGHVGVTGTDPSRRASLLTKSPAACSENIAYGYDDATEMVAALIVDDAVPSRGHRANLFDPRMKTFGARRSAHLLRKSIDVQLFCLDEIRG